MEEQKTEFEGVFMEADKMTSPGRTYPAKRKEGAILNLDTKDVEPIEMPKAPEVEPTNPLTMTKESFLAILREMLSTDQITPRQALEMRQRFGITSSYFTKKKPDVAKKRRKRKIANASRVFNRYNNSTKGQKREQG